MNMLLKHVKYDLLKYKTPLMAVLIGTGIVEILHIFSYIIDSEVIYTGTSIILILAMLSSFLVLFIYSIGIFSMDLSKKQGYMPFTTPTSSYTIIGSKLLTTMIITFITSIIIVLLFGLNSYLATKDVEPGYTVGYMLKSFLGEFDGYWGYIFIFFINIVIQWMTNILSVYLALTIAAALLGESKLKGITSFGIWIGVNIVLMLIGLITTKLFGNILSADFDLTSQASTEEIFSMAFSGISAAFSIGLNAAVAVGLYMLTCWIIEKKLSL